MWQQWGRGSLGQRGLFRELASNVHQVFCGAIRDIEPSPHPLLQRPEAVDPVDLFGIQSA
jgi:hypothetical protein